MLAGAARTFLNRYGVLPGREAVVFTTNDSAYDAALDLHRAGVRVQAVVDARTAVPARRVDECERAGIPVLRGSVVTGTRGTERVTTRARRAVPRTAEVGSSVCKAIACDLLLVSGGLEPRGAPVQPGPRPAALRRGPRGLPPGEELDGLAVAGSAAGVLDLAGCLADGQRVAREALTALAIEPARDDRLPAAPDAGAPAPHRWCCGGCRTRPAQAGAPSSSTCSATRRSPTSPARSAPACAPSSTSSATRPSAPRTTRARPPA